MSLLDRAVVTLLPAVPKRVVRKLSSRYIAGPALADARQTVARLNAEGKLATVDVLGEEVQREDEAAAITAEYVAALDAFEQDGLDANVSVKPTGLGLKLDYDLCKRNIHTVIAAAEPTNRFVRIDMEDSTTTDDTLRLVRELRAEGHGRVGPVLQASLKRTVDDAAALAGASVRLCKGIYIEPESIQFRDDQAVRDSFMRALETLIDGGCYAAIATHDEWLVDESLRLLRERALAPDRYEFQMLLGVRPELGDRIVAAGHRLRIYVPFGRTVVRVLAQAAAGEPEDRRLRGRRSGAIVVPQAVAPTEEVEPARSCSSSTTVVRRGAAAVVVRTGPPSTYAVRRRKPPQLDQNSIEMTRPRMPTIIRITPIAFTSRPSASAVTPHVRIAPTATNRMLTEIPMGRVLPGRAVANRRASPRRARGALGRSCPCPATPRGRAAGAPRR